jgi:hypothetical protein
MASHNMKGLVLHAWADAQVGERIDSKKMTEGLWREIYKYNNINIKQKKLH